MSWPPRITESAKNLIPTCLWWLSLDYFLLACSASFKEHEELGLQTSLVHYFHNFKKILLHRANILSLDLFLSVRNYLGKSPFCWLNLHLQTLKILILKKQQITQHRLSFILAGPSKRPQKPYNSFFAPN